MNTATVSYPFDVIKNGNDYVFTYKKAKFGFKMGALLLWPSMFLGIFFAYKKYSNNYKYFFYNPIEKFSMGIFYAIVYTILLAAATLIVINLLRRNGTFTLSSNGLLLNGTIYPYSDIRNLYIKAPNGTISNSLTYSSTGFIAFSNDRVQNIGLGAASAVTSAVGGVVNAANLVSNGVGNGLRRNVAERSFKICFLFGDKEKSLVTQVTNITAIQLLTKIDELK